MSDQNFEPMHDQCKDHAEVPAPNGQAGRAFWYPQMGGYHARAIAVLDENRECFDLYVWHNGEFPFPGEDEYGIHLPFVVHHCEAQQFIDMGNFLQSMEKDGANDGTDIGN